MTPTLLALLLGAATAPTDGVLVSPEVLELGPDRPFADVTVRNVGATPREIRAEALAWDQDESGLMTLSPADDVSMFPPRALLRPREERRFRLSAALPERTTEGAYRVALHVRDLVTGELATALVPAFQAPAAPRAAPAVDVACTGGRCRVVLSNSGTARFRPERIAVAVLDAAGGAVERELDPWWVLAGGALAWELPLPAAAAPSGVVVEVTGPGRTLVAGALARP